jgi:hypothetical protein
VIELKNTRSLDSTRLLLESKVVKYMKNEYDNKYGRLERLIFDNDDNFDGESSQENIDPEKIDLDYLMHTISKKNGNLQEIG